jgi:hypothetical protein
LALDDEKIGRDKGSRKKLQQSASSVCEALGEEAANDQELLEELLPLLLAKNPGINTFDFGIGVGLKSGNPTRILSQAKKYLQSDTTKAVSVFFLRGLIKGWYQTSPAPAESYLDASVGDDVWSEHFMSLQCALPMNCKTFARTLRSIESCTNSAWQYSVLGWGRTTDSLTIEQIFSLLSAIAPLTNGGEVSLEVISMVIHCASDRDDVYKASLATASLQLLQVLKWEDIFKDRNDPGHRIKGVLAFALQRVVSFEIALGVLDSLVRLTRATDRSYGAELFVKEAIIPFLKYLPVQTLDRIYISDESGHYLETSRIIGRPRSDEMTSLHAVPTAILLDWCNASPVDRYNFAASNCQLFGMTTEIDDECEPVGSSDNSKPCISDVALALLSEAQDKSAIVVCYLKRFIPTGYSGSLAEILKKRIPILDELNPDNDEPLRLLLADAKRNLEQRIVAEERREDADERERTGSFE